MTSRGCGARYLLIAADAPANTLQLGVADLPELVLRHRDDSVALGDQLAAVANKEAVVARKRLQDLQREFIWLKPGYDARTTSALAIGLARLPSL